MKECKYLYLSISPYDKGVYQTQVIDWLNLYREHGLEFELTQLWTTNPLSRSRKLYQKEQNKMIKEAYKGPFQAWNLFPRTFRLDYFDRFLFLFRLRKYLKEYKKVVLFCRYNGAFVVSFVNRFYPGRVIYYADLRGASTEEYIDRLKYNRDFSKSTYEQIARYYYNSFFSQKVATKVFAVSRALIQHYVNLFDSDSSKFVLYPCLSTTSKFYFLQEVRAKMRKELGIADKEDVFIYTGSLDASYNCVDAIVALFASIHAKNPHARLLIVAKKITKEFQSLLDKYQGIKESVLVKESVPNQEMVKYLNAADCALLLRKNVVLNNVSSPVKFAEFQLCGLPVIISESVFDYAGYCEKHHTGFVLSNESLDQMEFDEVSSIDLRKFNREEIAILGANNLSKESHVERIISELKVY